MEGSGDLESMERLKALRQEYHDLRVVASQLESQRQAVKKMEEQCRNGVKKLEKDMAALMESAPTSEEDTDTKVVRNGLNDISAGLPQPSNWLLQGVLGNIPVTLPNREDKVLYKQDYEQFKMANVTIMFILTVLNLYLQDQVTSSVVHCMSVWFYFTVILRELILISNGSKIKRWWMTHHYCSILMAILLLTWPPGECYDAFRSQFMLFSCLLSFVMGLQFRYQRAKLYRQVSMGEKHHMTISKETKSSNMSILILCLLGIYLFQLYNGISLMIMYLYRQDCAHCWQVPVLGVLFVVLALMNSSTLSIVLKTKKSKTQ